MKVVLTFPRSFPTRSDNLGLTGICLPKTLLTKRKLLFLFFLAAIKNNSLGDILNLLSSILNFILRLSNTLYFISLFTQITPFSCIFDFVLPTSLNLQNLDYDYIHHKF